MAFIAKGTCLVRRFKRPKVCPVACGCDGSGLPGQKRDLQTVSAVTRSNWWRRKNDDEDDDGDDDDDDDDDNDDDVYM